MAQAQPHTVLMSLRDDAGAFDWMRLKTFEFWRNMAVHFCICSLVGRWIEAPWCIVCRDWFGIYDPGSLVWGSPWYPFCVYGIGAFVCAVLLTPFMDLLLERRRTAAGAALEFYMICVLVSMVMELAMGWMLNQPDAAGVYPLWNNADLPLSILDQAWLPNDLLLGAVALVYTWVAYPIADILMAHVRPRTMNIAAAVIVCAFVLLCCHEFWGLF